MFYWSISLKVVKLNPSMQQMAMRCKSKKTLHGTVAWRAGTIKACSAYPGIVYEQYL